ncbi:DNA cytosine methyltransferase [Micromonospora sp. C51]|uniref:DNA cytosine methyltransferase n=1 Tax=Micromonospora sp. C51 TaxID=2824879 RepID=UPI001FFDB7D7|nr:DNA cytosine methyltransferase [Micromonospora sp. C51]
MTATVTRERPHDPFADLITDVAKRAANQAARLLTAQQSTGDPLWTPAPANGLTFVDIFCGAGGSSIGLANAGFTLKLAANHWQTAIDTHAANFRNAEHLCADVNNYDFRRLPKRADVLWASPICTEMSPAGGNSGYNRDDDSDGPDLLQELGHVSQAGTQRTRATFMDVIRATEVHRFKCVIVENVPDVAVRWELFDWWLMGMERLGYHYRLVSVNSAHIGGEGIAYAPQWRDRLYIVFIRKDIGRMPDLDPRPTSRCFTCEKDVHGVQTWAPSMARKKFRVGRYRRMAGSSYGQYWYTCPNRGCHQRVEPYILPAAAAIDWTNLGTRIGDLPKTKNKPEGLAPNTMKRIRAGLLKYGPQAISAAIAGNTYERNGYLRAWPAAGTLPPGAFTVNSNHDDIRVHPADGAPLSARTTKIGDGLVVPPPMLVPSGGTWAEEPLNALGEPARTVMANEKGCESVVMPGSFIAVLRRNADAASLRGPMPTVTAGGRHHALIVPYYTKGVATPTGDPLPTLSTRDRFALVGADELATRAELDAREAFYRMLMPRESLRAQVFPDSYVVLGGLGEQTMQAGNAVSCNVPHWIAMRVAPILLTHAAL